VRPNDIILASYASLTSSGTCSLANFAIALTAAIFISSLIFVALTSNAPLKIYGNPRTLLTWLG